MKKLTKAIRTNSSSVKEYYAAKVCTCSCICRGGLDTVKYMSNGQDMEIYGK